MCNRVSAWRDDRRSNPAGAALLTILISGGKPLESFTMAAPTIWFFQKPAVVCVLMMDTRFSSALQIIITVAVNEKNNARSTSDTLAAKLDAKPSLVRKLAAPLMQKNILVSSEGYQGGYRLGRPASAIYLSEIYLAVTPDKKIWGTRDDIPAECFVSSNMNEWSAKLSKEAEQALLGLLAEKSVEDAICELASIDGGKCPLGRGIAS
jgi:Rrf2 family transcriptional repressor of oqxAB